MMTQQYSEERFKQLCNQVRDNIAQYFTSNNLTNEDIERAIILNIYYEMFDPVGIKISSADEAKYKDSLTNPSSEKTKQRRREIIDFVQSHQGNSDIQTSFIENTITEAVNYVILDRRKRTKSS